MTKKIGSLAIAIAAFAMACADTTGLERTLVPGSPPSFDVAVNPAAVGTLLYPPPAGLTGGWVRICKDTPAGDPSQNWSFSVTAATQIGSVAPIAPTTPVVIAGVAGGAPECADVFHSVKNGAELDMVTIVEQALPANWALTHIHIDRYKDGATYVAPAAMPLDAGVLATRTATLYVNQDMERVVTFTNDFTPPVVTGCTYTKGWYRNNGSSTVIAVDGLTIPQVQAIFDATPGKPGSVTFGGDNTLLNLYQQFLAALNNLGGDANEDNGPAAVDAAIDAVQAGTTVTGGTAITTTLTHEQMSGYIEVLSNFNEGEYAGWPHCDDN